MKNTWLSCFFWEVFSSVGIIIWAMPSWYCLYTLLNHLFKELAKFSRDDKYNSVKIQQWVGCFNGLHVNRLIFYQGQSRKVLLLQASVDLGVLTTMGESTLTKSRKRDFVIKFSLKSLPTLVDEFQIESLTLKYRWTVDLCIISSAFCENKVILI